MKPYKTIAIATALLLLVHAPWALADLTAPEDSSASAESSYEAEKLLLEAQQLFAEKRSIDARAKLQKALKAAPKDYRPHMFLGAYYLGEVAHFRLAYRYLRQAEKLFEEQFGKVENNELQFQAWRQHARLLYLMAESEINLDQYETALKTLDRYGARYWDDWYPGTRAWVLMKLERMDEAVRVAQSGLLRGAEMGRTFNILGILLSLRGNRKLSLEAFSQAIKAEAALGAAGQVATPLNNAGEVYKELFRDRHAEAAWLKALQIPDGCDHILPSLNLANLYMDELRLNNASRTLDDFESCFAAHSIRSDAEHRALLALARGRIALRYGEIDKALEHLISANEREQWFGKIGTSQDDMKLAAKITLAQALEAKAESLKDNLAESFLERAKSTAISKWYLLRSWWLKNRAAEIAIDDLNDLEDLYIRHTDAMLEYPTLGDMLAVVPERALKKRLARITESDERKQAHNFYQLYHAVNLLRSGRETAALPVLQKALEALRKNDRMARAEAIANVLLALGDKRAFWSKPSKEESKLILKHKEELFSLLPSHLRYKGIPLPVQVKSASNVSEAKRERVLDLLLKHRFEIIKDSLGLEARYEILLQTQAEKQLQLVLKDRKTGRSLALVAEDREIEQQRLEHLVSDFISEAFKHKTDPEADILPELEITRGIL